MTTYSVNGQSYHVRKAYNPSNNMAMHPGMDIPSTDVKLPAWKSTYESLIAAHRTLPILAMLK